MKKFIYLIIGCVFITSKCESQPTNKMNYQAVARNASGAILANQLLGIRITIEDGSGGSILYRERQTPTTNQFGLFTLQIGNGTVLSGNYNAINWSAGNQWLRVDMDISGGTNYSNMGESELLSVPFANYAASSNGWSLTGNSGINSASNFIGTTDGNDVVFKQGGIIAGLLNSFNENTSFGVGSNNTGNGNTSIGYYTLAANISGANNIANGNFALYNNSSGNGNVAIGNEALAWNTSGYSNVSIGTKALRANSLLNNLVAVGDSALYYNGNGATGTQGTANTALGSKTLFANSTGGFNTATGSNALYSNTTGFSNTANGAKALYSNTTGEYNTAIGALALYSNITGVNNTAVGRLVLYSNTGNMNTATGFEALKDNTSGSYNSAFGANALSHNTTGINNTACGETALGSNLTGNNNTAHGDWALFSNLSGYDNTATGANAGIGTTVGNQNTSAGSNSLVYNTTGSYHTAIGYNTGPNTGNLFNTTCLGIDATATGNNMVRIGNSFVTSIGGQVGWSTISDGRFKENITDNVPGLTFITQLKPVSYRLNRNKIDDFTGVAIKRKKIKEKNPEVEFQDGEVYSGMTTGFIAQDVEAAAKKLGFEFSGIDAPKNENDLYGLRYAEFVVPLVKAVQELNEELKLQNDIQQQQIDELKKEIAALKLNSTKNR